VLGLTVSPVKPQQFSLVLAWTALAEAVGCTRGRGVLGPPAFFLTWRAWADSRPPSGPPTTESSPFSNARPRPPLCVVLY